MASAVNTELTISMVTFESLRVLTNNLTLALNVNRQYDSKFAVEGAKIGQVVNARKPVRYLGRLGDNLQVEDSVETSVPITLDTLFGVDMQFGSTDLTMSIDNFADRYLKPAMAAIGNYVDSSIAGLYSQIYQAVGTAGTTPNDILTYMLADVQLSNAAAPADGMRSVFLTPFMQATVVKSLQGLFQAADEIAQQYMKGAMGKAVGLNWLMDQNLATHTVGTYSGTPLVNGANQTGSTLITDGWGSGVSALNVGDTFTLAGVYSVNPQSRQSTNQLQSFVVTQTINDTTGAMTIAISPAIIIAGAYQTVTASPADNAALTVLGATGVTSPQGMLFHRDAMTLVSADQFVPKGLDWAMAMGDDDLGISVRILRNYNINNNQVPCRIEVLYGVAMLRPELACRIYA